jgi:ribonuclease HI
MSVPGLQVDTRLQKEPLVPLSTTSAAKNKKEFKEWFEATLKQLERYWYDYICEATEHLNWYRGDAHGHRIPRISNQDGRRENKTLRRNLPITFNHAHDLVEQRVNRLARFKPTFEVLPTHPEPADEQNARLMKLILKQLSRRNRLELLLQRNDRLNAIMGSSYVVTEWDQRLGPWIDPKNKKRGKEGDVRYCLQDPRNVFLWPARKYEDSPMLIEIFDVLHKDEAKKKYKVEPPSKMGDSGMYVSNELSTMRPILSENVIVYRLLYKPDELMPEGLALLCYQDGTIIKIHTKKDKKNREKIAYPYSHGQFPHERLVDIELTETLQPFASFHNLIAPQKHHDRILGLKLRNLYLLSHPKILMQAGTCKVSSWANTPLFVEYNGNVKPEVVAFGTSHPEVDATLATIRAQMEQLFGVQGVSRGAPPPGTRSGVQLLFFEEQEQQRASIDIIKKNEFIRRIKQKAAAEVGDHYPTSSRQRLVQEVGKNNEPILRAIKTNALSGDVEIEIQNATAFSDSKAVRNQQVLDFVERIPDLWTREQLVDILELGHSEKAMDIKTAALRKAEWEQQEIRLGNDIPEPGRHEDILVHLQTHYIDVQSIGFSRLPADSQQKMYEHIEVTEGLAEELAEINETFRSQLTALRQYPMFYEKTPPVEAAAQQLQASNPALAAADEISGGVPAAEGVNEFATPEGAGNSAQLALPPIE